MMQKLSLIAVGLGPGDPELITIKGLRAIQSAQVIFVPRSKSGEQSLALRIAQPWLATDTQRVIDLPLPMTRNSDELVPAWRAAAAQISDSLAQLATTQPEQPEIRGVYLLLGDPLLYGTFIYIWQQLAEYHHHVKIEIIPGITSFAASAASGRFPLSTTDDRVIILPATYETNTEQLLELLTSFDTIIFMKVGQVLSQILPILEELKLIDSTLYAERVGMPEEFIAIGPELHRLKNQRRPYLSLLIIKRNK